MSPQIAVVIGALGAQGSSVVSALLSSTQPYQIRALTSNAASPDAIQLASLSPKIEVLQTNLSSIDSLIAAFTGASFIFANTVFRVEVFMAQGSKAAQELEETHGLNIVQAAARVSRSSGILKQIIWSTLPDVERLTGGKYKIPHFQSKVAAERYLLDPSNGLKEKSTFLRVGMYGSNVKQVPYSPIYVKGAGKYIMTFPCSASTVIPMIGAETPNVGVIVDAIFAQPDKTLGKHVLGVAEYFTATEWAVAVSKSLNADVVFLETSLESYEGLWGAAGTEIGLMMKYMEDLGAEGYTAGLCADDIVTPKDLGVQGLLRNTEEALKELNWEEILA
ncbi:hypothetical protein BJX76DRAFT_20112 [Aspergillus varians]